MNDVLCWIGIGVIVCAVFILFVNGLCFIAKRSDHISDKQYEAYCRENDTNESIEESMKYYACLDEK